MWSMLEALEGWRILLATMPRTLPPIHNPPGYHATDIDLELHCGDSDSSKHAEDVALSAMAGEEEAGRIATPHRCQDSVERDDGHRT